MGTVDPISLSYDSSNDVAIMDLEQLELLTNELATFEQN